MHVHPAFAAVRHQKLALVPFPVPWSDGGDRVPDPVSRVSDPVNCSSSVFRFPPGGSRTNTDRHGTNWPGSRHDAPPGGLRPTRAGSTNHERQSHSLMNDLRSRFVAPAPALRAARWLVLSTDSNWLSSRLTDRSFKRRAWPPDARSAYRVGLCLTRLPAADFPSIARRSRAGRCVQGRDSMFRAGPMVCMI